MRGSSRLRKRMWVPAAAAACAVCLLGVWSTSGADKLAGIELQVDEVYMETGAPMVPGAVAGAPVVHALAVPVDGPRARPGFVSVLVHTDTAVTAAAARRADMRAFAAQRGGVVKYEYGAALPGVFNLRDIPESAVEALERLPGVIKVEKDEYHPNALMLHDSMPLIRGLQSQITGAGYSADGAGVRICIVDTGIDSDHIMYSDRIDTSKGYDFYNDDSNPEDDHGHGSHCSGIAAGGTGISWDPCGTGSMPFQGVAPEATLIGCKVLNSAGGGYDSDIIAGINYCADQSASGAQADVISMSIGTGNYSGPCSHSWAVAANNAVANGVVAVAASGNENYSNALSSPACGASVIAVGMTWKNDYPTCEDPTTNWNWGICVDYAPQTDEVGCFSNESDYLDVTAPGANVWSASIAAGGSSITGSSGTSMSCPHVAGLAALILDMDGSLTPAEVRTIIRDGSIDMGPAGFDRAYGYGRIDVLDTLALVGPGCSVPADCDDGLWCNGAEDCVSGSCVAGTPPNCNDGVACTDDSCNEGTDSCDNVANDANCDNGLWCDGTETCHITLNCQSGSAPNCNDGVGCTDDSCTEGTDSCDNIANNGNCDNGLFCDGAETCHATLDCQAGSDPCPGQTCDETNDVCCDCEFDTDCDDGLFCNGAETCVSSCYCQAGSDPCPGEICNETTDTCEAVECVDAGDCDDLSDCTTDTCVDNVCYNDCPGSVSAYPYTEGFESGWGDWVNLAGDGMDWTRNSGTTGSSGTGPSGAHGGTYYVYTEASSPNYPNVTAILEGPCFDFSNTSDADLTFWYHMYGAAMGTLDVQVSEDCVTWTNVWSLSGDQGNTWYEANVDLSAYIGKTVVIRFFGTTGSSYTSDICVDDITVDVTPAQPCNNDPECDDGVFCNGAETCVGNLCQPGTYPCPGQACDEGTDTCFAAECTVDGDCDDLDDCTVDTCVDYVCYNDCPISVSTFPYSEGFESGWGDWVNASGDGMDWSRNSGSTPSSSTGPSGAHGGTYYIYTEASSPNYPNVTAILDGPCFDLTSASNTEMTFWYHMYGSAMGTLYLEASEDCISWATVWSLTGNQGNAWYEATVDLSAYDGTTLSLRFRGVTGSSYTSDMSVDDITITATVGPTCSVPADCDDGVYCNGAEDCVGGDCVPGTAVDCNDGVGCTDDSCNEGTDSCDNVANDANCDNGLYCDGAEWCDAVSDCQVGTTVDCDDAVACTDDSCNEGTDSCDNVPNDGLCDDGAFCNGAETCHATLGCQAGSDPCAGYFGCDEVNDVCVECFGDGDCDDGLYCNGVETCDVLGVCQGGTAVDCNDGVGCTDDSCNEGTDSCDNVANDANCDNGLYCDGAEWCDAVSDCQAGTAVDCDDGVGCTDDSCNEGTDSCDRLANDANCDNGLYCDGAEWCHAVSDCQAGTAVDCDDGVGCTDDSCNEGTDSCDNTANDAYCPDNGLFCDGTEYCDAVADCSSTGDPCSGGEICNETTDTCDPGDAAKMEAGSVLIGGTAVTVNLTNTYVSPVVVCSIQYNNNTTPVVTRVTSVTSTSFDVYLQNPSGGGVATENVSCVVVEEGTWTIDGVNVEAQTYLSTVTDENNSWVGEAQTYGQTYTNPVVIGQVMSDNDPLWSVFWCQGTARTNPPSAGALRTGKEVAEDLTVARADETVGFIVFEAGHGTIGGVAFEALVGADTVRGVTNVPPYTYTFSTAFSTAPTVAVTTLAGMDGGNGGWSYTYGASPLTATTMGLAIDEDQVGDTERNHTPEQVGYVVFESSVVYP